MKLFRYLRNVVSGRIKYLNETNNPVVNELWNRLENLENPNALIYTRICNNKLLNLTLGAGSLSYIQTLIRRFSKWDGDLKRKN